MPRPRVFEATKCCGGGRGAIVTDENTVDIVLVGTLLLWRRRGVVKLVERDLYFTVQQPSGSLVGHVDPVEPFDVHPQLDETPTGCVRHVAPELAHARYATHSFRHPREHVNADCSRPHTVVCSKSNHSSVSLSAATPNPPRYHIVLAPDTWFSFRGFSLPTFQTNIRNSPR